MSKHWKPESGWPAEWDRYRARPRSRGRRGTGRKRIAAGELRLAVMLGLLLGLAATQVEWRLPSAPLPSFSSADGSLRIDSSAVRVIDGDTFAYAGTRIRIADIDTPEIHGRCPYETQLAARATERLDALLAQGPFELQPLSSGRDEDRYGRKLRIVTRDGRSIGDQLVAEGLARTWTGRREPWCA
jgi:endonuclease YncB( thermonuclease family)